MRLSNLSLFPCALAFCLVTLTVPAFASPVFDFVLTYQSTTVTFSLTGNVLVPVSNFAPVFIYNSGPGTVNGAGGYTISTAFTPAGRGSNIFATFTSSPALSELSKQTFAYATSGPDAVYLAGTIPAVYAPGPTGGQISPAYWLYNYIPGTYSATDYSFVTTEPYANPATLVVTQEATNVTPEPGTLVLLASGVLGGVLLLMAPRRRDLSRPERGCRWLRAAR